MLNRLIYPVFDARQCELGVNVCPHLTADKKCIVFPFMDVPTLAYHRLAIKPSCFIVPSIVVDSTPPKIMVEGSDIR